MKLPEAFINRMKEDLGDGFPAYIASMDREPNRSLRVNTLKISVEDFLHLGDGITLKPNGIVPEGFLVPNGFTPGKDPYQAAGLYYMQEASAQMPVRLLDPRPGEWVLDLCAAPGGKSGQIAAALQHKGVLVSNEINASRATVLRRNLERLGVRNAVICNTHPAMLCSALSGVFDAVLVDAPCSGEGMFRKEPEAVTDWSMEHVTACAVRQREILTSASQTVKPGGRLVYSTCTFSKEENEQNVNWFIEHYPDFQLVSQNHLYPHTSTGEGQFAALFIRNGNLSASHRGEIQKQDKCDAFNAFINDNLRTVPEGTVKILKDGRLFLFPRELPFGLEKMRILATGVELGEVQNKRFIPSHALFMAYPRDLFTRYEEPERNLVIAYLAGEEIPSSSEGNGYIAVGTQGYTLGFGKLTNGRIKNHLPKGLRFR